MSLPKDAYELMVWERIYCALLASSNELPHVTAAATDQAFEEWKARAEEITKNIKK